MELIKIDPADYGLKEEKAQQISAMFKPMLDKMVELEEDYNHVISLSIKEDVCVAAKDLRLRYVKVRTGTAAIHKELKAFYLQGGKFVDGWKNAQLMASQGIESKLMGIEKHFETLEEERIKKLHISRTSELIKYELEVVPEGLGEMPEEVWVNFLTGTKANYEIRIVAEKKAEEEKVAKEKAEALERERIKKENAQLKKETKQREENIEKEAKKRAEAMAIRLAKEQKAHRAHEAKLEKERKEKEAIKAELKAKKDAEEKAEKERLAKIEADLNKGDAAKVKDLIADLEQLKTKYQFKSGKNQKIYDGVSELLDKIVNYIKT